MKPLRQSSRSDNPLREKPASSSSKTIRTSVLTSVQPVTQDTCNKYVPVLQGYAHKQPAAHLKREEELPLCWPRGRHRGEHLPGDQREGQIETAAVVAAQGVESPVHCVRVAYARPLVVIPVSVEVVVVLAVEAVICVEIIVIKGVPLTPLKQTLGDK